MEKERAKRWEFLFERMYQADKSLNKPAFFDALDIEIHQTLESQMSDLRKEVEKMKGDEGVFGGAALTNSKCKICDSGFAANSTAGGICDRCRKCLDEVLLLMKK